MRPMTQHLLDTALSLCTESWKAVFLSFAWVGWLVQSTNPLFMWWVKSWRAADDGGHKSWFKQLCLSLSLSIVVAKVAIAKDLRVTCVQCSQLWQAQLSIALQARCTVFVASACLWSCSLTHLGTRLFFGEALTLGILQRTSPRIFSSDW